MFNPKVSILIPLYNSEAYIVETIESCINQTYKNIEIIIVDDGSSDNSLDVVKIYAQKYSNIIVETQKNSGAPVARNKAFSLSTGDYIQYIDADDLLDPDKIQLQMDILENFDIRTLVFGRWGTFKKNIENVVWKDLPVNKDYDDPKQFLIELWESGMAAITHLWLVPRVLVDESGGWDESLTKNQDGEFFARIIYQSTRIVFVKNSIGYYRKDNTDSISSQISEKALESTLKSFETYTELMKDNLNDRLVCKSLALVYSRFFYKIPPHYKDIIVETKNRLKSLGYNKPINTMKTSDRILSYFLGRYNVLQLKKIIQKMLPNK